MTQLLNEYQPEIIAKQLLLRLSDELHSSYPELNMEMQGKDFGIPCAVSGLNACGLLPTTPKPITASEFLKDYGPILKMTRIAADVERDYCYLSSWFRWARWCAGAHAGSGDTL
jgi:hypothetical protein